MTTKALYGLRTSPKQWQEHLSAILQKLGFTRLKSDACVFINKQSSIYLMPYVDDLLVVGDNYYNKILKAYNMDKCNPSATPDNKEPKPPIAAQSLDKKQHSMYRTAVGQLLWVAQLRADIAFAVEELSPALQQPDNEDLKNLKQLLRYIKGTTHYKVTPAPKAVQQ
eukprot:1015544-Amphidinium_carterae.1